MFRPIHIVWNQSILGNRYIENFELEKQCSAQNGAKSVALSMPMMNTRFVCVYLLPLLKRAGVDHFVKGNCQLHCQRYLYWLRARASVVATLLGEGGEIKRRDVHIEFNTLP